MNQYTVVFVAEFSYILKVFMFLLNNLMLMYNKWILFYFVDQVWRTVIEDKDLAKHIENKDQSNYIYMI